MIRNDDELREAVAVIDEKMADIQRYLGDRSHGDGKIQFPRGYIRTADHFRRQLSFIPDRHVKDNLAYALIQSDVYRWLTNRTDLYGSAREMIIKAGIALLGAICETMAVVSTRGAIGRRHSFCNRCDRMVAAGMIDQDVCDELHWLWEARAAIHIYELEEREYERYRMEDYNRAVRATRALRDALQAWDA